jgi:hypothetical protein
MVAARRDTYISVMEGDPTIPRVTGYLESGGITVLIHCPYCAKLHTHGLGPNGSERGHRHAHCFGHEATRGPGYIIGEVLPLEELKRAWPKLWKAHFNY